MTVRERDSMAAGADRHRRGGVVAGAAPAGVLSRCASARPLVDVPVVLAPMAGVTNRAFRRMCREYGAGSVRQRDGHVARPAGTQRRDPGDVRASTPRSRRARSSSTGWIRTVMAAAVRMVAEDDMADHIDLNMGCPVPKVTRKGGGAALPWKLDLFRGIVRAAVRNADGRPVTVKMRMGIDDDHLTYRDAARIAADEGVHWVALHARTAQQMYSGQAQWDADRTAGAGPRAAAGTGQRRHLDRRGRGRDDGNDRVRRRGHRPRLPGPALVVRAAGAPARRGAAAVPDPTAAQVCDVLRTARGTAGRERSASTRAARRSASTSPGTSRATRCASTFDWTWHM